MKKDKFLKAFMCGLASFASAMVFSATSVSAENLDSFVDFEEVEKIPVIDRDTATLTVRYFDDSEETVPVEGAEFTIYKVADFGFDVLAGNSGGYLPLTEELAFEDKDDADAYEATVIEAYEGGLAKNGGYTATMAVNSDGEAVFKDVPVGAYLITETKTMRYHVRSTPFLVSVPEMNETYDSWNFDVKVNPKQILAGDLNVTKKGKGKIASKGETYHVVVTFEMDEEGKDSETTTSKDVKDVEYSALMPDGTKGKVKSGQVIDIKVGQTLYIYDIPAGMKYEVKEQEAGSSKFDTTIKNATGTIVSYKGIGVEVLNDSTAQDTGVYGRPVAIAMAGVASLCLIILFVTRRKDDKADKQ